MTDTAKVVAANSSIDLPVAQRAALGRAVRQGLPRWIHGDWEPAADRPDPVGLLEAQETTRVPELIPIRHGRMAASAFAFYRGAAAIMASDLGTLPRTPLEVQLCGDAHLANFGGFASPSRDLVFDLNDFDETHPGPFEWDLKRLATSFEVAGRDRGFEDALRTAAVVAAARSYREAIREFAQMRLLEVWYSKLDIAEITRRWGSMASAATVKNLKRAVVKAESKDHLRAFSRLTTVVDGEIRLASDPPLLVPIGDLFSFADAQSNASTIFGALDRYKATLSTDRRHLLDRYRVVDVARKVVGVGSVGTRCWVVLLLGRDEQDPLFLQVKQAEASVLEAPLGASEFPNHGERVVAGQRVMQAASDILLGWDEITGVDGLSRDFYMRQLWDWKMSPDLQAMLPENFPIFAEICGWTLARAHARSGDAVGIAAYLGGADKFDQAIASFARLYADQNDRDHRALVDAIISGRAEATTSV